MSSGINVSHVLEFACAKQSPNAKQVYKLFELLSAFELSSAQDGDLNSITVTQPSSTKSKNKQSNI